MDNLDPIIAFNGEMLRKFSEQCIERMTGRSPILLASSQVSLYLRGNVDKEAIKDRLVIEQAAAAVRSGRSLTDGDIDTLFEQSKTIDRNFLASLVLPSFSIQPRYEDLAEIRKKRFRYITGFVEDLLQTAHPEDSFEDAVRRLYSEEQFRGLVGEILFLYCVEMKMLARSIKFLPPFNKAMNSFIDELVETMEDARRDVASSLTGRLFTAGRSTRRWRKFIMIASY